MDSIRRQLDNEWTLMNDPAFCELINKDAGSDGVRVNLGCGHHRMDGWINADADRTVNPDQVAVLGYGALPWRSNFVSAIALIHVLEHIADIKQAKTEMRRVLKHGGKLLIVVPEYRSLDAWGDDTHCRAFSALSFMDMYWPGFTTERVHTCEAIHGTGAKLDWLYAVIRRGN